MLFDTFQSRCFADFIQAAAAITRCAKPDSNILCGRTFVAIEAAMYRSRLNTRECNTICLVIHSAVERWLRLKFSKDDFLAIALPLPGDRD